MDRMSEQTAAALGVRINDLTAAVRGAENQVETNRQLTESTRSHTKWLWLVIGLLVIGGAFLVKAINTANDAADDAADAAVAVQSSQVTNCENANKTRAGQRAIWEFFFEVTEAGAGPDAPEAVVDFYHEFLAWIETDVLADRDCDNLDAPIAKPGPPPSYKKALKEALEQEAQE